VSCDDLIGAVGERAAGVTGLDVGVALDETAQLLGVGPLVAGGDRLVEGGDEPVAVLGVPPVPPALPMPTMASPTLTDDELPRLTVVSPEAFFNWRTATSPVTS